MTIFPDIKLIIWDLDNTFWPGSLSEGDDIGSNPLQLKLLQLSTYCGVINSICSKNDTTITLQRLSSMHVDHLFVLPSINWEPKGRRIKQIVETLGFRGENVLFIDDNETNLNEALFYTPKLMVSTPSVIQPLFDYYSSLPKTDYLHNRLQQYKQIERRVLSFSSFNSPDNFNHQPSIPGSLPHTDSDNVAFLYDSEIQATIHTDCIAAEQRIYELIQRTNQLNYTKKRITESELARTLEDTKIHNGYVTAQDKYGDYGIIGFFSVLDGICLHFLFSCRVLGLGIEDWVYCTIGKPVLNIVGQVSHPLDITTSMPQWINQCVKNQHTIHSIDHTTKILFKGPCDIQTIASYFQPNTGSPSERWAQLDNPIITEFTYVSPGKEITIEHHNHSINYLQFPFLSEKAREYLLNEIPFNDPGMFDSDLYSPDIGMIFLSTMPETSLAVYQNKNTGYKFAWGEWDSPLTDRTRHAEYISKKKSNYKDTITLDWLTKFSEEWEYLGRITSDEYIQNLGKLFRLISPAAMVCLLLGSEKAYSHNTRSVLINRHHDHKILNDKIREYAKTNSRLLLIDFTEYIHSEEDYTDSINHFQRRVYFEAAQTAKEMLARYRKP